MAEFDDDESPAVGPEPVDPVNIIECAQRENPGITTAEISRDYAKYEAVFKTRKAEYKEAKKKWDLAMKSKGPKKPRKRAAPKEPATKSPDELPEVYREKFEQIEAGLRFLEATSKRLMVQLEIQTAIQNKFAALAEEED